MPITWLDNEYIVHHINGQCIIVLSSKMREQLPAVELYVKGIPRNFGPDELIPVFSCAGLVHSIRLFMDYNEYNRGFAYVSYVDQKDFAEAMRRLNGMPIAVNHRLELFQCRDPRTLYLGNVAHHITRRKVYQMVSHLTRVSDVELTFTSHPDFIRAYTKLSRVRHIFGPNCWIKYDQQ